MKTKNAPFIALLLLSCVLVISACNKDQKAGKSDHLEHQPFDPVDSIQLASGDLYRIDDFDSQYVSARNIDVWKPEDFDTKEAYRILWMHDGQMLFDKNKTWNGQEWGIDENLSRLSKKGKIPPTLVVATWSIEENRHANYFPQKPFDRSDSLSKEKLMSYHQENSERLFKQKPNSDDYLKLLVEEVKPLVEKSFDVKIKKSNTTVGGSSMGGLISFYAVTEYPEIFGNAICMSTHWPGGLSFEENPFPQAFFDYLDRNLPEPNDHKFYFDFGTETLDELYPPYQQLVNELFEKNGFDRSNFRNIEFEGHEHKEIYWQKRIGDAIQFTSK